MSRRAALAYSVLLGLLVAGCGRPEGGRAESSAEAAGSAEARRLPHYDSPDFTPRWNVTAGDPAFHRIRPFRLLDQHGGAFTERDLRGKIVVADFIFTACSTLCPRMMERMQGLQARFRDDDEILLLSHSVTPETDTPEVLRAYGAAHHVESRRWKLLTGSRDEIYDLGRRYYFVDEDLGVKKSAAEFLHTENFVLVDKNRQIRGIYNSQDPVSMKALVADIEVLKREAEGGRSAPVSELP